MSEELGAVLEAPEVIADEVVDQGIDGTPVDVVDSVVDAKEEVTGDWRKVPAELKEFFKTPAGKPAKDAWFERNAYKEKFPEGIKQVNELTAFLDEHGGREGLTTALGELQGKAAELDAISEKIANADPSLVNDLSPEAVTKLGPVMNNEWAKADPEGWGHAMTGVLAATLTQENEHGDSVASVIKDIGIALRYNDTEGVKAAAAKLQQWTNGMITTARSAPQRTQQTQQPNKVDARQQDSQREEKYFYEDVERAIEPAREQFISKELDPFFKRRPNDKDAHDLAVSTVKQQMAQRLLKDEGLNKSFVALLKSKNKEAAAKLMTSREQAAITEIAPKVGRMIFGNPGTAATPVAKTPAGTPSKADVGFSFIDKPPKPELINYSLTTQAMIMRGKFILKDGRKLTLEG